MQRISVLFKNTYKIVGLLFIILATALTIAISIYQTSNSAYKQGMPAKASETGKTYYVASAGSSTGLCTISAPCNFSRAQSLAILGDVVVIQDRISAINITKPGLTIRGGMVDGVSLTTANSAAILISADNTTLEDIEIINGWSYGFRTVRNVKNVIARRLNIHHNVRENFGDGNACKTTTTSGWGSGMRAYVADGMVLSDSRIWENCGEGFSAVMSKNISGSNLELRDNWSVHAYPDQTESYSLVNSTIICNLPGFQRNIRTFAALLGAESYDGVSSILTKNITFKNNSIHNCRGVGTYQEVQSGNFENVTITDNQFNNIYGTVIRDIIGINIVTSPNFINNSTLTPTSSTPTRTPTPIPTTLSPTSHPTQTPVPTAIPVASNDTTPPEVLITSPLAGSTVGKRADIRVSASDVSGISQILIFLDTSSSASRVCDNTTSCSFTWRNMSLGNHTIRARAVDNSPNRNWKDISISIIRK